MRKFAYWLALGFVTVAGQAVALEVGSVRVRSHLNEPLVATVPVQVANIQERNSLAATLAPDTEYVARGLQPLGNADDFIVQVTEGGGLEQMLIELRSLSAISEPFLGLVLQLSWDGGSEVKEFTVLLDPAPAAAEEESAPMGLAPAEPVAAEPEEDPALQELAEAFAGEPGIRVSGARPQVVIRKVHPDDYLSGRADSAASLPMRSSRHSGDSYGPVAAGETLWGIASQVRPGTDVSMQQVMAAIHAANPQAFAGGYSSLKKGAVLSIPSAEVMRNTAADSTAASAPSSAGVEEVEDISTAEAEATQENSTEAPTEESEPGLWMSQDQRASEIDAEARESKSGLITKPAKPPVAEEAEAATEEAAVAEPAQQEAVPEAAVETDSSGSSAGRVEYAEPEAASEAAETTALQPAAGEPVETAVAEGDVAAADAEAEAAETPETVEDEAPVSEEASAEAEAEPASGDSAASGGNTRLLAGIILAVLIATYLWYRRRRANEEDYSAPVAPFPVTDDARDESVDDIADEPVSVQEEAVAGVDEDSSTLVDEDQPPVSSGNSDEAIAQADTYLSYGLYESAAEVLERAIEAEPDRAELRMKLLETYETAGNGDAFVAAAQNWEGSSAELDDASRERISGMAQRVAPGVALFGAAAAVAVADDESPSDEAVAEEAADELEQAEELPLPDFDLDQPTQELESAQPEPLAESEADSVALDLDLDSELEETAADEVVEDLDLPDDLELDLGGEDLQPTAEDTATTSQESEPLEFDLGDLDLDVEETTAADTAGAAPVALEDSLDFNLEDEPATPVEDAADESDAGLSLAEEPADEDAPAEAPIADESEYDVKMDLAQAYLEMGEPDLAKGLLDEVLEGGNDAQREAAQKLLSDLA